MKTYRLIFADMNGALRGKLIAGEHYSNDGKYGMPRSVLVADIEGSEIETLPEFYITTGDKDMLLVPDPKTITEAPGQKNLQQVIVDVANPDGQEIEVAPRTLLKQALKDYADKGIDIKISNELEFFLINPDNTPLTSQQLEGPYADLNALDRLSGFVEDVINTLRKLDLSPEMIVKEAGQGQLEVTFGPTEPLFMADRTLYYKQFVKEFARKQGLRATFMAQPFVEDAGSGGHIHLSLWRKEKNLFSDDPQFLENFIAGQLRYMRQAAAIFAPHPNSYKRWELGHSYAPTKVNWSEDQRNTSLRLVGQGDSRRVEHRLAGADTNPYLVFTAVLRAGLMGIENDWNLQSPAVVAESDRDLPKSLPDALELLDGVEEVMGQEFVRVFKALKQQELKLHANAAEGWEIQTYGPQV